MKLDQADKTTTEQSEKDGDLFHTLRILDEVSRGRPITQRDLSKKLGIALGMINSYLKRLVRQGYIHVVQAEGKRLHYLLTPKGIAEKSALTYRYIKRSYQVFTEARERMRLFFEGLAREGVQSVVLYKTGVVAEIAILVLQDTDLELVGIVDDAGAGQKFLGYSIMPSEALRELKFDRLLITTEESVEAVAEYVMQYGVEKEKVCSLQ